MSTPADDPHADATPREPRETGLEPPAPATASEILGQVLGGAARKAGLDPNAQSHTGHVVWAAMGGWRGVLESVLPGLAFVLLFTFTQNLLLSLVCSVGLAAAFTVALLVQRSTLSAALGGLIATVAAAALALWTGRGQDNFVPGLITNAAYGTAFLVSALIGWSLIGLAVGFLMNEGTAGARTPQATRLLLARDGVGRPVLRAAGRAAAVLLLRRRDDARHREARHGSAPVRTARRRHLAGRARRLSEAAGSCGVVIDLS